MNYAFDRRKPVQPVEHIDARTVPQQSVALMFGDVLDGLFARSSLRRRRRRGPRLFAQAAQIVQPEPAPAAECRASERWSRCASWWGRWRSGVLLFVFDVAFAQTGTGLRCPLTASATAVRPAAKPAQARV